MHALIPLLFIFVFINSRQLKEDLLYRANIFSLVGINYFVIFYYTVYWYKIFPTTSPLQYVPGLIATSLLLGVALSPWNKKSHIAKTTLLVSALFVALGGYFLFDTKIKEALAKTGGFFSHKTIADKPSNTNPSPSQRIPSIGVELIKLDDSWDEKSLKSGHRYFMKVVNDMPAIEIRPNCITEFQLDTPTYISNVLRSFEVQDSVRTTSDVNCSILNDIKRCLIRTVYSQKNTIKEQWHWLVRSDTKHSIKVGVLFYQQTPALTTEAEKIIASINRLDISPTNYCHTPAAWL